MKLVLLFNVILLCLLSKNAFTQDEPHCSEKVIEFLGSERYENSKKNNPGVIKYLCYKASHGYQIANYSQYNKKGIQQLDSLYYKKQPISVDFFIDAIESKNFNFLFYSFPNFENSQIFKLGETDKVIILKSNKYINQKITSK